MYDFIESFIKEMTISIIIRFCFVLGLIYITALFEDGESLRSKHYGDYH